MYKPSSEQYLERFHPELEMNTKELAHNAAGTYSELSDDWSLPFKKNQNSVMFNNQLHSQIDLGVVETY